MNIFELADFPYKIANYSNFLHLLTINFLDFAHQNAADKAVQHRFIQLLNGSILPDLPDKGANITFLSIRLLKHSHQFLQTALIFFLFLFHGSGLANAAGIVPISDMILSPSSLPSASRHASPKLVATSPSKI